VHDCSVRRGMARRIEQWQILVCRIDPAALKSGPTPRRVGGSRSPRWRTRRGDTLRYADWQLLVFTFWSGRIRIYNFSIRAEGGFRWSKFPTRRYFKRSSVVR
jgi:hypothetical protein